MLSCSSFMSSSSFLSLSVWLRRFKISRIFFSFPEVFREGVSLELLMFSLELWISLLDETPREYGLCSLNLDEITWLFVDLWEFLLVSSFLWVCSLFGTFMDWFLGLVARLENFFWLLGRAIFDNAWLCFSISLYKLWHFLLPNLPVDPINVYIEY